MDKIKEFVAELRENLSKWGRVRYGIVVVLGLASAWLFLWSIFYLKEPGYALLGLLGLFIDFCIMAAEAIWNTFFVKVADIRIQPWDRELTSVYKKAIRGIKRSVSPGILKRSLGLDKGKK